MTPIIRKLYKDPEDIKAALKRHLVFFNTEPNVGGIIHGATIAMEEQRANGAPIVPIFFACSFTWSPPGPWHRPRRACCGPAREGR